MGAIRVAERDHSGRLKHDAATLAPDRDAEINMILGARHAFVEVPKAFERIAPHQNAVHFANLRFRTLETDLVDALALIVQVAVEQTVLFWCTAKETVDAFGEIAASLMDFSMKRHALANQWLDDFRAGFLAAFDERIQPALCRHDIVFDISDILGIGEMLATVSGLAWAQEVLKAFIAEPVFLANTLEFARDGLRRAGVDIDQLVGSAGNRHDILKCAYCEAEAVSCSNNYRCVRLN